MRINELINFGTEELAKTSDSANLDARLLLGAVTNLNSTQIVVNASVNVSADLVKIFRTLIARRKAGEPLAYLIGRKEFWSLELEVNSDTLVPRPDTELLVEKSLEHLEKIDGALNILELATGSGAISIALASELCRQKREFKILATDKSQPALDVAHRNICKHQFENYIKLLNAHWYLGIAGRFDLIVVNPPYIALNDLDLSPDTAFEPHEALYAGPTGIEAIVYLALSAPGFLSNRGIFLSEIGWKQKASLQAALSAPDRQLEFHKDLGGRDRVMQINWKG